MTDHRGVPHKPDARDDFGRQRRWARCEVCGGWLLRVEMLRGVTGPEIGAIWDRRGEPRTEWHHRKRARHA